MPKQPKETPGKWKTIRVRRTMLALLNDAIRANPVPKSFQPYFDVETVSDSHMFDIAAALAVQQITGQLFKDLLTELKEMVPVLQNNAAAQVAAHFGATIRVGVDGSFTIITEQGKTPLPPLDPPKWPAEMMVH